MGLLELIKRDIAVENVRLMRVIGKQVAIGEALHCPLCIDQLLSSIGDREEILFCPHCGLELELRLITRG
jgi:hypothetical protein